MATVAAAITTLPDYRHQTYDLKTPDDHARVYDQWASTYDDDVMGSSTLYVGPAMTVQAVQAADGRLDGKVLDAGCGTGLAGVALAQAGARHIDGIDVSTGMLQLAEKTGVYQRLLPADMQKPLDQNNLPSDTYDVVTCVGTFTTGHVGPDPALGELVRVLKKGGVLAATIYYTLWTTNGFEAEVQRLQERNLVDVLSTEITDYRRAEGNDGRARMLVLRKR